MRARNIKPGLFKNDVLAEVEPLGRILFTGLWCMADREGRLEDRPRRIKAEILPYDDCDVDHLLQQLEERGFVHRYQVAGERYIVITGFTRHQRPHSSEVESVIPPPDGENAPDGEPAPESRRTNAGRTVNLGMPDGEPREAAPRPDTGYLNADTGSRIAEVARETAQPPPPPEDRPEIIETAEILIQAPWVGDELPAVIRQVARSFDLVEGFDPRDGPLEAEGYAMWRGYHKKPPSNWYQAWLNWIKRARKDATHRRHHDIGRYSDPAAEEPAEFVGVRHRIVDG